MFLILTDEILTPLVTEIYYGSLLLHDFSVVPKDSDILTNCSKYRIQRTVNANSKRFNRTYGTGLIRYNIQ